MIHIFLGNESKLWLAAEVLRHSILRRTRAEITFHDLALLDTPLPFALPSPGFKRWFVPYFCDYKDRAIYLDVRALFLADIEELFNHPMEPKGVLAFPIDHPPETYGFHTALLLLDNTRLAHWIPATFSQIAHEKPPLLSKVMHVLPNSPLYADFGALPSGWFAQDTPNPAVRLLHFATPPFFPWTSAEHPSNPLFLKELRSALETEQISLAAILKEIETGRIYPNLLADMARL